MNIIKIILIGLAVLIIILLLTALFVKNEYKIERQIVINKPRSEVFEYIKYLKNQNHYNVWIMADPNMKKNYSGEDGTVGFIYAWDGNDKAGKGEEEITNLVEQQEVAIELRFEKPFKSIGQTHIGTTSVSENQTTIKWSMEGYSVYPMNLTNILIDRLLGKDLEKSLTNLRNILEKQ